MQGLFKNEGGRFKTKKELKEAIKMKQSFSLEATSIFGNEYGGDISDAPDGNYTVVGPDPYKARNWYASIKKAGEVIRIT